MLGGARRAHHQRDQLGDADVGPHRAYWNPLDRPELAALAQGTVPPAS